MVLFGMYANGFPFRSNRRWNSYGRVVTAIGERTTVRRMAGTVFVLLLLLQICFVCVCVLYVVLEPQNAG